MERRIKNRLFPQILYTLLVMVAFTWSEPSPTPSVPTQTITLEACLKHAINHSPEVERTRALLKGAQGEEFIFWSTVLPNIKAEITTPPALITASVNQRIYDYATPARYRAAQYTIAAAKANFELAVNESIFAVREAYSKALLAQKSSVIRETYAQELEKSLKTVDLQFEAAKITKNEVQRLHVRTTLARQTADDAKIQEEFFKNDLLRLSGLPLKPISLEENENFQLPQLMDSTKLIEIAFQQRRDLYVLENIKLGTREQIQIIKSLNVPRVDGSASSKTDPGRLGIRTGYKTTYINEFERFDDLNTDVSSQLEANAILSWRIYDGGQVGGLTKMVQSEVVSQEALLQRIRINIPSQVKTAIELVNLSYQQLKQTSETSPETAIESADNDFSAGKAKQLDLLDTQENVVTLRIQKAFAESNLSFSKAQLDRATGLGIRFIQDPSILKK